MMTAITMAQAEHARRSQSATTTMMALATITHIVLLKMPATPTMPTAAAPITVLRGCNIRTLPIKTVSTVACTELSYGIATASNMMAFAGSILL